METALLSEIKREARETNRLLKEQNRLLREILDRQLVVAGVTHD